MEERKANQLSSHSDLITPTFLASSQTTRSAIASDETAYDEEVQRDDQRQVGHLFNAFLPNRTCEIPGHVQPAVRQRKHRRCDGAVGS
ncbi:hypothetical protein D3C75_1231970 [compost metagenome]